MSYYTDITSPYIWILLWRGQTLSYHVLFVLYNMFWRRNLLKHQQWSYRHSQLIATSAIQLSIQVVNNLPVLSGEQDIGKLCPFPTLRTCLHRRIWWRSCSTAPIFAILPIEEWRTRHRLALRVQCVLWRLQLHTMICSHDLAFWTFNY